MSVLSEKLLAPETRPDVVKDCTTLIDEEVASKSGVSGLAIKGAFKVVKGVKPGIIPDSVNALLDDFVAELEPFYAECQDKGASIDAYVVQHDARIADALLSITDRRAERSRHKTLVKAYQKLRPQGQKQVVAAMPRIGAMLKRRGL